MLMPNVTRPQGLKSDSMWLKGTAESVPFHETVFETNS